ncbi:unnamed protein product [Amoebophrya sp. A120]|nr:unnamed protein product [Amoebophrya sp. A120]|eukprot:GSA120T00018253001.1
MGGSDRAPSSPTPPANIGPSYRYDIPRHNDDEEKASPLKRLYHKGIAAGFTYYEKSMANLRAKLYENLEGGQTGVEEGDGGTSTRARSEPRRRRMVAMRRGSDTVAEVEDEELLSSSTTKSTTGTTGTNTNDAAKINQERIPASSDDLDNSESSVLRQRNRVTNRSKSPFRRLHTITVAEDSMEVEINHDPGSSSIFGDDDEKEGALHLAAGEEDENDDAAEHIRGSSSTRRSHSTSPSGGTTTKHFQKTVQQDEKFNAECSCRVDVTIDAIDVDVKPGKEFPLAKYCIQVLSDAEESDLVSLRYMRRRKGLLEEDEDYDPGGPPHESSSSTDTTTSGRSTTLEPVDTGACLRVADIRTDIVVYLWGPSYIAGRLRPDYVVCIPLAGALLSGPAASNNLRSSLLTGNIPPVSWLCKGIQPTALPSTWYTFFPASYRVGGAVGGGMAQDRDFTLKVKLKLEILPLMSIVARQAKASSLSKTAGAATCTTIFRHYLRPAPTVSVDPWISCAKSASNEKGLSLVEDAIESRNRLTQLRLHWHLPLEVFCDFVKWLRAEDERGYLLGASSDHVAPLSKIHSRSSSSRTTTTSSNENDLLRHGPAFLYYRQTTRIIYRNGLFFLAYYALHWTLFPLAFALLLVYIVGQNRRKNPLYFEQVILNGSPGGSRGSSSSSSAATGQEQGGRWCSDVPTTLSAASRGWVVWEHERTPLVGSQREKALMLSKKLPTTAVVLEQAEFFLGMLDVCEKCYNVLLWDDPVASTFVSLGIVAVFAAFSAVLFTGQFIFVSLLPRSCTLEDLARLSFCLAHIAVLAAFQQGSSGNWFRRDEPVPQVSSERAGKNNSDAVQTHDYGAGGSATATTSADLLQPSPTSSSSEDRSSFMSSLLHNDPRAGVQLLLEDWRIKFQGFYDRIPTWSDSGRRYLALLQRDSVAESKAFDRYLQVRLEEETSAS